MSAGWRAFMALFQKGGMLMLTLDMRMDIIRKQYVKEFPGQQLQSDIAREIAELLPDASGRT